MWTQIIPYFSSGSNTTKIFRRKTTTNSMGNTVPRRNKDAFEESDSMDQTMYGIVSDATRSESRTMAALRADKLKDESRGSSPQSICDFPDVEPSTPSSPRARRRNPERKESFHPPLPGSRVRFSDTSTIVTIDSHSDLSRLERESVYYNKSEMRGFLLSELQRRTVEGIETMSVLFPEDVAREAW